MRNAQQTRDLMTIIPWTCDSPSDWTIRRVSHAFTHICSGTTPTSSEKEWFDGEIPWITSTQLRETIIMEPLQTVSERALECFSALKIHPSGSIVIAMYGATIGRVGILGIDATTNQACCALAGSEVLLPKFVFYWLIGFREEIISWYAAGGGQPNINREKICSLRIPAPTIEKQQLIVNLLDKKTAEIDSLISKKQRQIELLHERRAAVINRAITKGLDQAVTMKDSDIDWLGKIPAHWTTFPIRRALLKIEQGWSPVAEQRAASEDEWAVIKLSAVSQGNFRETEHKALNDETEPDKRFEIREGDLLVTRSNTPDLVGDCCYVAETRPRLMLCDLVYRLTINEKKLDSRFLCYVLLSRFGRFQIESDARGTSGSMVKVSQEHIKSWLTVVPPVSEQRMVADFLDEQLLRLEKVSLKISVSIERLQECRSALISKAVTGKINVKEEVKV